MSEPAPSSDPEVRFGPYHEIVTTMISECGELTQEQIERLGSHYPSDHVANAHFEIFDRYVGHHPEIANARKAVTEALLERIGAVYEIDADELTKPRLTTDQRDAIGVAELASAVAAGAPYMRADHGNDLDEELESMARPWKEFVAEEIKESAAEDEELAQDSIVVGFNPPDKD